MTDAFVVVVVVSDVVSDVVDLYLVSIFDLTVGILLLWRHDEDIFMVQTSVLCKVDGCTLQ